MKTELVNTETGAIVEQSESAQMIDMIGRLASDPNADIDKMERLMAMRERMDNQRREEEFNTALADAQEHMPVITRRGKGRTNDYALWEDLNEKIKPILAKNGLSISYRCDATPEMVNVTATLRHKSGFNIEGQFPAPIEIITSNQGKQVTNGSQARGSAMSYGKRYVTIGLLNLTTVGDDDDAYSTASNYDTSPWTTKIMAAKSKEDLDKISAEIKADPNIPKSAIPVIRAAWAGQAKQLEKTND